VRRRAAVSFGYTNILFFYAKRFALSTASGLPSGDRTFRLISVLALTAARCAAYYCALMLDCLPERVEPLGLADVGRRFRAMVPVERCERLAPLLTSQTGELAVQLDFGLDERRIRALKGVIKGEVTLVCQRCLNGLSFPLDLKFRLGIVTTEAEVSRLPDGYEPLLVTGEPIRTLDVIEDEILLAMPDIPLHDEDGSCTMEYQNPSLPEKPSPFAVLEKLKS
jgi:uncharacterized protein